MDDEVATDGSSQRPVSWFLPGFMPRNSFSLLLFFFLVHTKKDGRTKTHPAI